MHKQRCKHTRKREMALAEGVKELASELRLVDVVDLVSFIHSERFANVAHLVNSSAELYYKQNTFVFGASGDVNLKWGDTPSIMLDMEFRHRGVSVFFRLMLEALHAGVEITYISFANPSANPEENTRRLVAAIADARFSPVTAAAKCGSRAAEASLGQV